MTYQEAKKLVTAIASELNELPSNDETVTHNCKEEYTETLSAGLAMNPEWKVEPGSDKHDKNNNYRYWACLARGPLKLGVFITLQEGYATQAQRGKLRVSAILPTYKDMYLKEPRKEFSMTAAKGPRKIAKDIMARVFQNACEIHAEYVLALERQVQRQRDVEGAGMATIYSMPFLRVVGEGDPSGRTAGILDVPYARIKEGYDLASAQVVNGDQVRFERLSVPPRIANQILKMILKEEESE